MGEKDDVLGLSMSLGGCGMVNVPPFLLKMNYMQKPPQPISMNNDLSQLPETDVNLAPPIASNCVNDNVVSSPNSTLSSISSDKQIKREVDDDDGGNGDGARKKLRLTKGQAKLLEETFNECNTLNSKQKQALAVELNLWPRQVEVWFQNRRAR